MIYLEIRKCVEKAWPPVHEVVFAEVRSVYDADTEWADPVNLCNAMMSPKIRSSYLT